MEIGNRQHIRDTKGLGNIALALHFTHAQGVTANTSGSFRQTDVCDRSGSSFSFLHEAGTKRLIHSVDEHAAVDVDHSARDIGRKIGSEEQVDVRDVARIT